MNWRSIGEQLNDADEAAHRGHAETALEIYHLLLSEKPVSDRQMQHFLFRRLAIGYIAIGAEDHAKTCFANALELSVTDAQKAMVHHDVGDISLQRGLNAEAYVNFHLAKECYAEHLRSTGQQVPENTTLAWIDERVQEARQALISEVGMADSWPSGDYGSGNGNGNGTSISGVALWPAPIQDSISVRE